MRRKESYILLCIVSGSVIQTRSIDAICSETLDEMKFDPGRYVNSCFYSLLDRSSGTSAPLIMYV